MGTEAGKALKAASKACNACHKRKGRCIGNPCSYCLKKNIACEFTVSKKRGPPRQMKLLTALHDLGFEKISHVQEMLNNTNNQMQFVDFYFQYIGRSIPKECKANFTTVSTLKGEYAAQMYIIAASIMQFYGNHEVEQQCIAKAKSLCSLFDADTLESAVSLLMMTHYLGYNDPKSHAYALIARNIAQLPSMQNSLLATKIKNVAHAITILFDKSITKPQRYAKLVALYTTEEEAIRSYGTQTEFINCQIFRIRHMLYQTAFFEDEDVPSFLLSVSAPLHATIYTRVALMEEWRKLEALLLLPPGADTPASFWGYSFFTSLYLRFLIEWRTGDSQEAFKAATEVLSFFKQNMQMLALWFNMDLAMALLHITYFLKTLGVETMVGESIQLFQQAAVSEEQKTMLRAVWGEMNSSSSPSSSLSSSLSSSSSSSSPPSSSSYLPDSQYMPLPVQPNATPASIPFAPLSSSSNIISLSPPVSLAGQLPHTTLLPAVSFPTSAPPLVPVSLSPPVSFAAHLPHLAPSHLSLSVPSPLPEVPSVPSPVFPSVPSPSPPLFSTLHTPSVSLSTSRDPVLDMLLANTTFSGACAST